MAMAIAFTTLAQSKVAIFDPVDKSNTGFKDVMREILSTGLSKSTSYKPVERALIDKVLEENKYQSTGMVDDSKISELGKQMGADFVCVSIIQKMGSNFFITAKLVNVTTGSVELQEYTTTTNGENDLFEKIEGLANKLTTANSTATKTIITEPKTLLPTIEINYQSYMVLPNDLVGTYNWVQADDACYNLNAFGYDDWILPENTELTALYENKLEIGGFGDFDYWSRTSSKPGYPWHLFFYNGKQYDNKNSKTGFHVRCIRKK